VDILHVTNGDAAGDKLRTFVAGDVVLSCDVLHDGPVRRGDIEAATRTLARADGCEEVALWFEHDLFDQLNLIRTLTLLDLKVRLKPDATKVRLKPDATDDPVVSGFSRTVTLICIDAFPGVDRFIGLGQLTPEQLQSLWPSRRPVTREQFDVASRAWEAFCSPDPLALEALSHDASIDGALPFLRAALHRLFEEYPWTTNGLSRTEAAALRTLRQGRLTGFQLFPLTQRTEDRPFLGDWALFAILERLAAARLPLIAFDRMVRSATDLGPVAIELTGAGRDVLDGAADAVVMNGIDRWVGGVHLTGGSSSPWRWDSSRKRLLSFDGPRSRG
jgi:hypothetical protein